MKTKEAQLYELDGALIQCLLSKIESGQASAGDLNVARQLLKDNNVGNMPEFNKDFGQLMTALPFNEE